jgi:hypothetical protein
VRNSRLKTMAPIPSGSGSEMADNVEGNLSDVSISFLLDEVSRAIWTCRKKRGRHVVGNDFCTLLIRSSRVHSQSSH